MRTISLRRTDLNELVFDGELVATSNCHTGDRPTLHECSIYRTADGAWVVAICYHPEPPSSGRADAVVVDGWDNVVEVLSRYPVTHVIASAVSQSLTPAERRRRVGKLVEQFDEQITALLSEVERHTGCR